MYLANRTDIHRENRPASRKLQESGVVYRGFYFDNAVIFYGIRPSKDALLYRLVSTQVGVETNTMFLAIVSTHIERFAQIRGALQQRFCAQIKG